MKRNILILLILLLSINSYVYGAKQQITDNDIDDTQPSLYDGNIVWIGSTVYTDTDLYYYNGSQIINLTNNAKFETAPSLQGGQLAWVESSKIFLWDGVTTTQITGDFEVCNNPSLFNNQIAYDKVEIDQQFEIYLWNGTESIRITNNDIDDFRPSVYDGKIAWEAKKRQGSDDYEIYYYNGSEIIQITDNNVDDRNPRLYDGIIVWESNYNIYYWDGSSIEMIPNTSEAEGQTDHNSSPSIYENNIVYIKNCTNGDNGIYYYDLNTHNGRFITNEFHYKYLNPLIYKNKIVAVGVFLENEETVKKEIFSFETTDQIYDRIPINGNTNTSSGGDGGGGGGCFLTLINR